MAERHHSSLQADDEKEAEKLNDEFVPDGAQPLCPRCLTPCHPLQFYCHNCDSNEAINPLASYMPFVRIRFNTGMFGKMWQRVWYDEDTSVVCKLFYIFMIIIFLLIIL